MILRRNHPPASSGPHPRRFAIALILLSTLPAGRSAAGATDLSSWAAEARRSEEKFGESWSVYVKDIASQDIIFEFGSGRRLIPASNRKLQTFAVASDHPGPEGRFRTTLGLTSRLRPRAGTLHASLVLRSAGDPTMSRLWLGGREPGAVLGEWLDGLRDAGVRRLTGDVVIDASAFGPGQDRHPEAWGEDHVNRIYARYPSAVALNQNLLEIIITPGRLGAPPAVRLMPGDGYYRVVNDAKTVGGAEAAITARFSTDGASVEVGGSIGVSAKETGLGLPLPEPLRYQAELLRRELESRGIAFDGKLRIETAPGGGARWRFAHTLGRHESPDPERLLAIMLTESDNFIADQFWRAAGFRADGDGSPDGARAAEEAWYSRNEIEGPEAGHDGSGLSRRNAVSAFELTSILETMASGPSRALLLECLAVSGRTGTLRRRTFDAAPGRVVAKTGTLNGVRSLSGFVTHGGNGAREDEPAWIFSIIANTPSTNDGGIYDRQNDLVAILIGLQDRGYRTGKSARPGVEVKRHVPGTKVLLKGTR